MAQRDNRALDAVLQDLPRSRRLLRPLLTATYHCTTAATAPVIAERAAAQMVAVGRNADARYSAEEAALAAATLARLAVRHPKLVLDRHLRPLASGASHEGRLLLLRILQYVFEVWTGGAAGEEGTGGAGGTKVCVGVGVCVCVWVWVCVWVCVWLGGSTSPGGGGGEKGQRGLPGGLSTLGAKSRRSGG